MDRQLPKNPFRKEKHTCEKCKKIFKEDKTPDKKIIDGDEIEMEFVPLCPKCFKKYLKGERLRQKIIDGLSSGILTAQQYTDYKNKKLSRYELDKILSQLKPTTKPKAEIQKVTKEELEKLEFLEG